MKELKEPFSVADICRFSIVARNACIEFQKNEDTDNKSNDMMSDIKEYAHNLDKTLQLYYDEPEEMCDEGVLKKEQEAFNRFFKTIGIEPNWMQRSCQKGEKPRYAFNREEFVFLSMMLQEQNAPQSIWKKIRLSMNGKHKNYELTIREVRNYLDIVDMIDKMLQSSYLPAEDIQEHVFHMHEKVKYEDLLLESIRRMLEWQASTSDNKLWGKELSPARKNIALQDRILWLKWIYYNVLSFTYLVAHKFQTLRQDDFDNIDETNREYFGEKLKIDADGACDADDRWTNSTQDPFADIFSESAIRQEDCERFSRKDRENMEFAREAYQNMRMGYRGLEELINEFEDTRKESSKDSRQRIANNIKQKIEFHEKTGGDFEETSIRYMGETSRKLLELVLGDIVLNPDLSFLK